MAYRVSARWPSYFFCFAKKSNQKKATPTIGLFPRIAGKKAEQKKLASLKQFSVLIAFLPALLGANQRGPMQKRLAIAKRIRATFYPLSRRRERVGVRVVGGAPIYAWCAIHGGLF